MKRVTIRRICVLLTVLCMSFTVTGCEAKRTTFSNAYTYYEEGNYEEALKLFETLENFRGSDELAEECREKIAEMEQGD